MTSYLTDATTSKAFARLVELGITGSPVVVPQAPTATAVAERCIYNVQDYLQTTPGRTILGWRISVWHGVILEAIGHAIASTSEGLLCVTPPLHKGEKIFFVPDPKVTVEGNGRMPSKRLALNDDVRVHRFIEVRARIRSIKSSYPIVNGKVALPVEDAAKVNDLLIESQSLLTVLTREYGSQ